MKTTRITQAKDFYKDLTHPVSQQILGLIQNKEFTVTEIYNTLNLEQSRTSQMLNRLKSHGIVIFRKEKKKTFYMANKTTIKRAEEAAKLLFS